jgi:hypothetical protein
LESSFWVVRCYQRLEGFWSNLAQPLSAQAQTAQTALRGR